MSRIRPVPVLTALAALGVAAAVWIGIMYVRSTSEQTARLLRLEGENRDLRTRSEQLSHEMDALRRGVPVAPAAPSRPEATASHPAMPEGNIEQARLLIQFRERLGAANSSIENLQTRIQELEAQIEKMSDENKGLAASEAELTERLAGTNRVLAAVQTELKGKENRLASLEALNARLREESRATADKVAQVPRLVRELEEINRRRETYLSNILRRYREVTDQYRALSARLEDPRGVPVEGLGRIANAISMTEEDLRQLSSLNAQAGRIQQQLAGK